MPRKRKTDGRGRAARPRAEAVASYAALAVVILFVVVVRVHLLEIPLERDDGAYAHFGQLILDGGVPYASFYEIKPPGLYYAYAALIAVFGDTLRGVHAAFLCVNVVSTLILFAIGRKLMSPLAGAVVAASFAMFSLIPRASGFTAQSEHLVALLAAASLLAALRALETERTRYFVASGALASLACMVKQSALAFVVSIGLIVAVHAVLDRDGRRRLARTAGAFLAAVALVYLVAVVAMAAQGVLRAFWFWSHEFPLEYVTRNDLAYGARRFVRMVDRISEGHLALWALAALGLLAVPFAGLGKRNTAAISLFALGSFASLFSGMQFYPHYALQWMPAAAILVGVAVETARRKLAARGSWRPGRAALASAAMFAVAASTTAVGQWDYYFDPDLTAIVRQVYGENPFPEAKVVGDFIRRNTRPGDRIAVFGSEPEVYFYSGRRCPSSHAYFEYTVYDRPEQARWLGEFIRDVEAAMPKYLVHFPRASLGGDVDPDALEAAWSWFRSFAERHYTVIGLAVTGPAGIEWAWGADAPARQKMGQTTVYVLQRNVDPSVPEASGAAGASRP